MEVRLKVFGDKTSSVKNTVVLIHSLYQTLFNRLVRKLRWSFFIEYSTDEIHSQQMSFPSVSIPFAHDFEGFDPCIDVLNDNAFLRQLTIEQLLLYRQRTLFAFLEGNLTVGM